MNFPGWLRRRHLTVEELIRILDNEPYWRRQAGLRHLRGCPDCAAEMRRLSAQLEQVEAAVCPSSHGAELLREGRERLWTWLAALRSSPAGSTPAAQVLSEIEIILGAVAAEKAARLAVGRHSVLPVVVRPLATFLGRRTAGALERHFTALLESPPRS